MTTALVIIGIVIMAVLLRALWGTGKIVYRGYDLQHPEGLGDAMDGPQHWQDAKKALKK